MIQTLIKKWLLLALCGVLNAIISVIYFSHAGNGFHTTSAVVSLGEFTLAGGACMMAAGIWSFGKNRFLLLLLSGLASSALGLLFILWRGPLAFRTIALLIVVMAMSIGIYELAAVRTFRRQLAEDWLLRAAGAASVGFALAFLAFAFHWIKLDQPGSPGQSLRWMGFYFGFCAICMPGLALQSRHQCLFQSGRKEALPPL